MIQKKIIATILCFIMILLLSCPINQNETEENDQIPPLMKFRMLLINNSDMTVDFELKEVRIGAAALENTTDIFKSNDDYLNYLNNYSIKENFSEYDPGIGYDPVMFDISGRYDDAKAKGTISKDNSDDLVYYKYPTYGDESNLIRLVFSNTEERILAGWPKYYYSKLSNVVKYGFCYNLDNFDKKLWDFRLDQRVTFICYSINTDDPSGDITGYSEGKIYSLKVTINGPDDIQMEVLPETGEKIYIPSGR